MRAFYLLLVAGVVGATARLGDADPEGRALQEVEDYDDDGEYDDEYDDAMNETMTEYEDYDEEDEPLGTAYGRYHGNGRRGRYRRRWGRGFWGYPYYNGGGYYGGRRNRWG